MKLIYISDLQMARKWDTSKWIEEMVSYLEDVYRKSILLSARCDSWDKMGNHIQFAHLTEISLQKWKWIVILQGDVIFLGYG